MFNRIKARFESMGTIKALCERAEEHARQDRQAEPGAEHFLLAAFDLPDGTARRAFAAIGSDPDGFHAAIARQYADALTMLGLPAELVAGAAEAGPPPAQRTVFDAAASGKEVMQALAARRGGHNPLLGAHVVAIVAAMPHGVAARALKAMGIDAGSLQAAAERIFR